MGLRTLFLVGVLVVGATFILLDSAEAQNGAQKSQKAAKTPNTVAKKSKTQSANNAKKKTAKTTSQGQKKSKPQKGAQDKVKAELVGGSQPVMAVISADWCSYCRKMQPVVSQLRKDFAGRAKVVKVDFDRHRKLATELGVTSIPAFVMFENGQVVGRRNGVSDITPLAAMIESRLKR